MPPPAPLLQKAAGLLLDDGLGRRQVLLAILERLLTDPLEVIDVEKASAIAIVDTRVKVARDGNIQDDQRAASAVPLDLLVALQSDDRLWGACRAQDNIRLGQYLVELLPADRDAATAPRHRLCLFGAAIGYPDTPRLKLTQMAQRQLAHLAGADHQHRLIAEMVENLAHIIYGRAGYGDVPAGDAGLAPDALGDQVGVLKEGVQDGSCRAVVMGQLIGPLDLA